jgi:tetratricopeptide (TPR) repeat protein
MALRDELLTRCERLETQEEYLALLDAMRKAGEEDGRRVDEREEPLAEAWSLLLDAAHSRPPDPGRLRRAFLSDAPPLLAAASLCLVTWSSGENLCRELLFGPDGFKPSKVSANARWRLLRTMGLSGNQDFVELLNEALLEHPHFCPESTILQALERLGAAVDEEEFGRHPVTVTTDGVMIFLHDDFRFTGYSVCPSCDFFPCRINRSYRFGIQDCKLFRRTSPDTLGEIVDRRADRGSYQQAEKQILSSPQRRLSEARRLMADGDFHRAIPILAQLLINYYVQQGDRAVSLAWIDLADCFSALGEPEMEFVALREALVTRSLISQADRATREKLESFIPDPQAVFRRPFPKARAFRLELRAVDYKKRGLFTPALDCYVEANLCESGRSAGTWFEMGECHRKLGELHLAELFMIRGADFYTEAEITLKTRFLDAATEVRRERRSLPDPGLNLSRRKAEREAARQSPSEIMVDPPPLRESQGTP